MQPQDNYNWLQQSLTRFLSNPLGPIRLIKNIAYIIWAIASTLSIGCFWDRYLVPTGLNSLHGYQVGAFSLALYFFHWQPKLNIQKKQGPPEAQPIIEGVFYLSEIVNLIVFWVVLLTVQWVSSWLNPVIFKMFHI